jgi:hypothetical protein
LKVVKEMGIVNEISHWVSFLDELEGVKEEKEAEKAKSRIRVILEKSPEKIGITDHMGEIVVNLKNDPTVDAVISFGEGVAIDTKRMWLYVETKYERYQHFQSGVIE